MRRRAILLPPLALAVLGALGFGWTAAGLVEQRALSRVEGAARAAGHDWLRPDADGALIVLRGVAPDAAAAAAALDMARGDSRLIAVVDAITVRAAPPQPSPPAASVALQILRGADGAALLGAAPNPQARDRLTAALGEALGVAAAAEMLAAGARDDPPGWRMLEVAAVAAAEALRLGRVSIEPGSFAVTGLPASDAARIAIERTARALGAAGVRVSLGLSAPAAALGAPVIEVRLRDGVASVGACVAPGDDGAARLTRALAALGAPDACAALDASDDPDWTAFAEAGLKALARAAGGRFRLEARDAAFTAVGQGDGRAEAAVARLAAAMPEAFSLATDGVGASATWSAATPGAVWLRARATPDLVLLTGAAPDVATRAAVLSYAAARFGAERVHDGMAVAEAHGVEGWRAAALAGIDALAELDSGSVEVVGGRIAVAGVTRTPLAARAAHLALSDGAPGWSRETRVLVDLPARAEAARLAPDACAAALSAQAAETPIRFAVGSAAIDAESAEALDQLASTLRRCARGAIEVGGHTDSQGSAGYNLSLSQARAEAVRAALISRGASMATLTARGYGESAPIADNANEEGRARNRRTAFSAVAPEQDAAIRETAP